MAVVKWERILVPTDLSPVSRKAVDYAHSLAEMTNAELHVLHVARDMTELAKDHGATGLLEPGTGQDAYDEWLGALLGESGTVRRVEAMRAGAHAPEIIVDYAKKHDIQLIVMASHGRTGLTHLLMGSVTEKVLRSAPCPLLVIRP